MSFFSDRPVSFLDHLPLENDEENDDKDAREYYEKHILPQTLNVLGNEPEIPKSIENKDSKSDLESSSNNPKNVEEPKMIETVNNPIQLKLSNPEINDQVLLKDQEVHSFKTPSPMPRMARRSNLSVPIFINSRSFKRQDTIKRNEPVQESQSPYPEVTPELPATPIDSQNHSTSTENTFQDKVVPFPQKEIRPVSPDISKSPSEPISKSTVDIVSKFTPEPVQPFLRQIVPEEISEEEEEEGEEEETIQRNSGVDDYPKEEYFEKIEVIDETLNGLNQKMKHLRRSLRVQKKDYAEHSKKMVENFTQLLSNDVRLINVDWTSINQDLQLLEEQYVQSLQSFQSYLEIFPLNNFEPVVQEDPMEISETAKDSEPVEES